jgi:hypothetical protein
VAKSLSYIIFCSNLLWVSSGEKEGRGWKKRGKERRERKRKGEVKEKMGKQREGEGGGGSKEGSSEINSGP